MANEKKHRYRWDHLNDFRRDGTGAYVYTGKSYVFDGDRKSRARYLAKAGFGDGILLLLTVLPQCLPPTPFGANFFTLIPWLFQCVAVYAVTWATIRLIANADQMREYRLQKTALALPRRALFSAGTSFFTFLCQMGYGIFCGWNGSLAIILTSLFSAAGAGALSLILYRFHKKAVWKEKT